MTPEELDEARAKEAQRLWESGQEAGSSSWVVAARLAREGWTPPEPVPVDPDILAFREWAKRSILKHISGRDVDAGRFDDVVDVQAYLAGARMAREQERERAKVLVWALDNISDADQDEITDIALKALAKYRGDA